MAWSDVPDKLAKYAAEKYAPADADGTLLREFGATELSDVQEHLREDFEKALDYRLGACVNLAKSTAKRWRL